MVGKFVQRTLAVAICIVVGGSVAAQEKPAVQSVVVAGTKDASDWKRAESVHFVVYSDAAGTDLTGVVNNLERLDYLLRIYLRDALRRPVTSQKLTFYYHGRIEGFKRIAGSPPSEAVGLYNSCPAAVQGFGVRLDPLEEVTSERLATHRLDEGLSYIFEAYTRHFLYRYTDIRTPSSFVDGLAQYFSGLRFSDTQMVVGRTPAGTGNYLNFLDDGHPSSLDYRAVLAHPDWRASGDAGAGVGPEAVLLEYQAKSWLLTHYMLSTEARRAQMAAYLDLAINGTPAVSAFEQAFGMKVAELDRVLWRYRKSDAQVLRVDFPVPAGAFPAVHTLSRVEGEVVLASAQLKSCPDRKTGEALLSSLSRQSGKNASNEFVQLTLSRAQIDWGNPNDAVAPLTALLSAKPGQAEALQLLGMAHLRLAERQQGAARDGELDAARRFLTQAHEINPGSSETAYALFKAELDAGAEPSQLALSSAIAAWKNAPEVSSLARAAALAYAYTGQAAPSAAILTALAQHDEDAASAAWAKRWQQRLGVGVKRTELAAELRLDAAGPSFKEWTVAHTDIQRRVECKANLEGVRRGLESSIPFSPDKMAIISNIMSSVRMSCAQ